MKVKRLARFIDDENVNTIGGTLEEWRAHIDKCIEKYGPKAPVVIRALDDDDYYKEIVARIEYEDEETELEKQVRLKKEAKYLEKLKRAYNKKKAELANLEDKLKGNAD